MTKKENKKIKIKKFLLKTLHIICYILSALFIILAVLAGVRSCSKKPQKVNAENEYVLTNRKKQRNLDLSNKFLYSFKYVTGTYDLSSFNWNEYLLINDLPADFVDDIPIGTTQVKTFNIDYEYYYHSEVRTGNSFNFYFKVFDSQYGHTWRLYLITFTSAEPADTLWLFAKDNEDGYNYVYDAYLPFIIYLTEENVNDYNFNTWFNELTNTDFIFNKQFNYNALLGANIGSYYGYPSINGFTGFDTSVVTYEFTPGYFISNGEIFNKIRYVTETTSYYFYWDNQQNKIVKSATSSQYYYKYIEYVNTDSPGLVRRVNTHDRVAATADNIGGTEHYYYYLSSSTWLNDQYRYITFLQPLTDDYRINLQSFNNNNQSYYSGGIISGFNGGDNIFDLLSFAFMSIQPLFNMMILPSITIGTLIFLPLVVTIVYVIIKLIKK